MTNEERAELVEIYQWHWKRRHWLFTGNLHKRFAINLKYYLIQHKGV